VTTIERHATIEAPAHAVWTALADFPGISRWAVNIDHSSSMTETTVGLGAVRRIQTGRTTLVETVQEWEPGRRLAYDITGLPPIVRSVVTRWTLAGEAADSTDVSVRTDVDAGPRPPQRLIARLVARKFGSAADEMLAGLTTHVERSVTR